MEASTYLRFVFSLVLVLGAIFAVMWALKRWGLGLMTGVRIGGGGTGSRRLALVEILSLDTKRRLVLVRRDDCEHLLLLGGESDLVVERNCPAARFQLPAAQPETGS
jgi:flagellar protein FliO/FliZ